MRARRGGRGNGARARRAVRPGALALAAALAGTFLALAATAPARAIPAAASAAARPARPAQSSQPAAPAPSAQPGPSVQALEWWFPDWDVRTKVWPLSRGAGVTVALLDSGVQANLPDIRAAVVPGGDTTGAGTNGMTDDNGPQGHGTGLASLIAGQGVDGGVLGIAPAAKILPVVVGGRSDVDAGGTPASIAAGIRYAVQHGAQVINMSLGDTDAPSASSCDPAEQDAVAYALQHNVILVAAAGNEFNSGNPPEQPASCAGVLAVGAVAPSLKLWPDSEQQPYVAVTAPGSDITTLAQDGGNYFVNGTSCSAAFVSGEAALVRSRYPSMPWYQVVQRILNTALPEGSGMPNTSYGFGIVRIPGALNAARYKVAASAPDPVLAAYQQWLGTPQGRQFTSPARPRPRPARSTPAAAPTAPGGGIGPAAVFLAVLVVVAGITALSVVAVRRRRRRS